MNYIYRIKNKETKQEYVGSSVILPMQRWRDHIKKLKEWDSELTRWQFEIIEVIDNSLTRRELERIEAKYILAIPANLRLNDLSRTAMTQEKYDRVKELLGTKQQYLIAYEVGLSPATISKIKHEMEEV